MKSILLFILVCFVCQTAIAQEILWEKKFGWNTFDQLHDGIQISESSIIGIGNTEKFGTFVPGNTLFGLMAIKIDIATGDTIWMKNLYQMCNTPHCVAGENGLVYVVAPEAIAPYRLRLTILDTNGNIFFRRTLDSSGEAPNIQKLIRTKDSNFIAIGSQRGFGTPLTVDMYAIKFDWLGNVIWNQRYNGNPNSGGNHIEEIPGNQFLLSGNAGSRIWRIKIDSAGNVLEDNFLYQTPSLVNFDEKASIKEHPFQKRVLNGNISSSSSRYYFGLHNSSNNQKDWGGEQGGGIQKPYLNTEGNILQMRANFGYWLNNYNADSSINWSVTFTGKFGAQNFFLNQAIYLPDSSAVFVGKLGYIFTSQADDFFFCRIKNVGVPYDPSIHVSNREILKGETLLPYPNPSLGTLVFKGLKEEGQLQLYNVKGQIVKELAVKPNQQIHVGDLVSGLYLYRIQTKTRFFSGKVVKN